MDKTELLNVIADSLKEENQLSMVKLDNLLEDIDYLTRRVNTMFEAIERVEAKYSAILDNMSKIEVSPVVDMATTTQVVEDINDNVQDVTADINNTKITTVIIDEYANNLASRVEYCLNPYYYDERERNSNIFKIEQDLTEGKIEPHLNSLNEILDTHNLTDEMYNYISEVIVDLVDFSKSYDPKKYNREFENLVETYKAKVGSATNVEVPTEEDEVISSNISVVVEENIDTVNDVITTHYKKLESGLFFADWVTTNQNIDYRVKDALASIDYIIDDAARRKDIAIVLDENNVLGIQTPKNTTFYKDENGGNKISTFLIDVKNLLANDYYTSAITNCYDVVRSVEREQGKMKKKDSR